MKLVLTVLICFVATLVGAITGIGGGIIIKPLLDAVSGLPVATIQFLSGCTVLSMAAVSLARSRKHLRGGGMIQRRHILLLSLGAAAGGVAGKELFEVLRAAAENQGLVVILQNSVMVALVLGVFCYTLLKSRIKTLCITNAATDIAIGLVLGVLGAFLGIGGGPINLVVLHYFYAMDTKEASFSSIFIILFSQLASLLMVLVKSTVPPFESPMLLLMVLGGAAGGFLGRLLSDKLSHRHVEVLFQVLLAAIAVVNIGNIIAAS